MEVVVFMFLRGNFLVGKTKTFVIVVRMDTDKKVWSPDRFNPVLCFCRASSMRLRASFLPQRNGHKNACIYSAWNPDPIIGSDTIPTVG
jgi:hypothetical protein